MSAMTVDDLLDRYEQPAHRGRQACPPARRGSATNPRCGDVVTMFAEITTDRLSHVTFDGSGCTISQAAADVLAELAEGQSLGAARALELDALLDRIGRDAVRTRRDCAAVSLHALHRALGTD